jgi:hypothetical protein
MALKFYPFHFPGPGPEIFIVLWKCAGSFSRGVYLDDMVRFGILVF